MILIDTNVLRELMAPDAPSPVHAWADRQRRQELWLPAISVMETVHGIERLPPGRRREQLTHALMQMTGRLFAQRIAPFDEQAATEAGRIGAERELRGRPVDIRDTMIAGIAIARGATLATRNTRHFDDLQVPIVNPWTA